MTTKKKVQALEFGKFESSAPEMNMSELPVGWSRVKITRITPTTDRFSSLTENVKKDKVYEWQDETPQVAVIFVGKEGSIINRFNLAGYERFEELSEAQQKTHISAGEYAVNMETKERVLSEKRVSDCRNILNNLFASCKRKHTDKETGEITYEVLPEGSTFEDITGCELEVKVEATQWDGKEQKRTVQYRKFSEVAEQVEDF